MEKEKEKIIRACHDLVDNGHSQNTGIAGNVSIRDREDGFIAVTPSQTRYDLMETEDLVVVDGKGNIVESKDGVNPTSELAIHLSIYEEFDGVNSVIHSHPKFCNTLALYLDEIPPVLEAHGYFYGHAIPVIERVQSGSRELADSVTAKLRDKPGLVIRNHGIVAIGKNIDEALARALEMENNSEIYYRAKLLGLGEPEALSRESIELLKEKYDKST